MLCQIHVLFWERVIEKLLISIAVQRNTGHICYSNAYIDSLALRFDNYLSLVKILELGRRKIENLI